MGPGRSGIIEHADSAVTITSISRHFNRICTPNHSVDKSHSGIKTKGGVPPAFSHMFTF